MGAYQYLVTGAARVDFDAAVHGGEIVDGYPRLVAACETVRALRRVGVRRIILLGHYGRPSGERHKRDENFSLAAVAKVLASMLNEDVQLVESFDNVVGMYTVACSEETEIFVFDNTRFRQEERSGDASFGVELASLLVNAGCVLYCVDAFASIAGSDATLSKLPHDMPFVCMGPRLEQELRVVEELRAAAQQDLLTVFSGGDEKWPEKIDALGALAEKANRVVVGGLMALALQKAQGLPVPDTVVSPDSLTVAENVLEQLAGTKLDLASDFVFSRSPEPGAETMVFDLAQPAPSIPDGWFYTDIGPRSCTDFGRIASEHGPEKYAIWNATMSSGHCTDGTDEVLRALSSSGCRFIPGGGSTLAAISRLGVRPYHESVGGGALLKTVAARRLEDLSPLHALARAAVFQDATTPEQVAKRFRDLASMAFREEEDGDVEYSEMVRPTFSGLLLLMARQRADCPFHLTSLVGQKLNWPNSDDAGAALRLLNPAYPAARARITSQSLDSVSFATQASYMEAIEISDRALFFGSSNTSA